MEGRRPRRNTKPTVESPHGSLRHQFADAATHLRVAVGPDRALTRAQSTLGLNAVTTLALCEEQCGDAAGAVATLEPARSLAVSILYNLGRLKLEAGDDAGAQPCLEAAALIAPDDEDVRHLAGVVFMLLGRHDEAEAHLARATALEARCVGAWYDRGRNLAWAGRAGAREYFEEVLRREPGPRGSDQP
jgi:tetratricopeptide (TPR) repeat protein